MAEQQNQMNIQIGQLVEIAKAQQATIATLKDQITLLLAARVDTRSNVKGNPLLVVENAPSVEIATKLREFYTSKKKYGEMSKIVCKDAKVYKSGTSIQIEKHMADGNVKSLSFMVWNKK